MTAVIGRLASQPPNLTLYPIDNAQILGYHLPK